MKPNSKTIEESPVEEPAAKHEVKIRLANFMDSSLKDLDKKGNLNETPATYNPGCHYEKVVHFTPYPGDLEFKDLFQKHRIELFAYRNPAFPRLVQPFAMVWNAFFKLRRERINLIRGRLPYLGSLIGCVLGKLLGIPSVVSLGGDNRLPQERNGQFLYGSRKISYWMEETVYKLCNKIIAPNQFTRAYVEKICGADLARDKVEIIPWYLQEEKEATSQPDLESRIPLAAGRTKFLITGFLNRYKFTDVLFESIDKLPEEVRSKSQFIFCGEGPLFEEGKNRFKSDPGVFFAGWQPREIVHALQKLVDVLLVPMSGFVLLEAARLGKTVVAGNIEWHPELIENEVTGFLVDSSDPAAWMDVIGRLVMQEGYSKAVGAELKKRFDEHYNPENVRQLELELYQSLIPSN